MRSRSKFDLMVKLGQKCKVLVADSFCTYLLVHVWKKKKIGPDQFYGYFSPDPIFLTRGGSIPTCGSAFFSRYQSEILTHFSLCQNLFKNVKKKNLKKKMGCGHLRQSRLAKNRFNSQFFRLLTDFSIWWLKMFA